MENQKTCSKCNITKQESEFTKHRKVCKKCISKNYYENRDKFSKMAKERFEKIKNDSALYEQYIEKKREYKQKNRQIIIEKHREYNIRTKEKRKRYYLENKDKISARRKEYRLKNKQHISNLRKINRVKNIKKILLRSALKRATRKNIEFSIVEDDINIPDVCPVLGIPLKINHGVHKYNSPSIDRIDSRRGYTRDNIEVISHRANTLKNDGNYEEFEKIVEYIKKRLV